MLNKSLAEYAKQYGVSVKQTIDMGGLVIVRFDSGETIPYGDTSLDRNICAFSHSGELIWQIESAPIKHSPKPYMHVDFQNNQLVAENWVGVKLVVNLENGFVKPMGSGQRPW